MAGYAQKISCLMGTVLLCVLLGGCGGQLLSHREIVRAAFFTAENSNYTVTLLTSDQQSEDADACKMFTGHGMTGAAAWNAAAETMNGQPFYGLMDLAVLPAGCRWPMVQEIADLLQSTARPAPEIALFVLDAAVQTPIQDQIPTLYDNLKALEENRRLHCGLQTLSDNADTAAIPISAGQNYQMMFYNTHQEEPVQVRQTVAAQLAAVLCGQAYRMDCTLTDDLHLAADAAADIQPLAPDKVRIYLTLRSAEIKDLSAADRPDAVLRQRFEAEVRQQMETLMNALYTTQADPLDLRFWLQNRYGPVQGSIQAEIVLRWDGPAEA